MFVQTGYTNVTKLLHTHTNITTFMKIFFGTEKYSGVAQFTNKSV